MSRKTTKKENSGSEGLRAILVLIFSLKSSGLSISEKILEDIKSVRDTEILCQEIVDEHVAELDPENPKDYIDQYLLQMEREKDNPDTTFRSDCELELLVLTRIINRI